VQDLHYGAVDLQGGTTYSGLVPDRPPPGADRRRLIAATAIRVTGDGPPQVLDPASAVDLSDRVRDGALSWSVPSGRWKLFGFWMRPSLMRSKAPGGGPDGWLVVDHFSRSAIDLVLRDFDRMLFGGDMASLLRRAAGDVFEDSLEVEHGPAAEGQSAVFWTPALLSEFARRRGYALTRWLPGLFEEFTFPGDAGERLKGDFDRTLNDLLIDDHLRPIRRWADRKGLRARGQAYQAGAGELGLTENNRLAAALQKADVETLGFGDPIIGTLAPVEPGSADARTVLDRYRQVVSGAHLSGANEITNEWGAVLSGQFRVRLEDLLALRRPVAGGGRVADDAARLLLPRLRRAPRQLSPHPPVAGVVRVLRRPARVLGLLEPALAGVQGAPRPGGVRRPRRRRRPRRPAARRPDAAQRRVPGRRHRRHAAGAGESGGPSA
jgi:hypothetical protein